MVNIENLTTQERAKLQDDLRKFRPQKNIKTSKRRNFDVIPANTKNGSISASTSIRLDPAIAKLVRKHRGVLI